MPDYQDDLLSASRGLRSQYASRYRPLLARARNRSLTAGRGHRRRAAADAMHSAPRGFPRTGGADFVSNLAQVLSRGSAGALATGAGENRDARFAALAGGRDAQLATFGGLGDAARLQSGEFASRQAADATLSNAYIGNALRLGGFVVNQGVSNQETGGSFFTPNVLTQRGGQYAYEPAQGNVLRRFFGGRRG